MRFTGSPQQGIFLLIIVTCFLAAMDASAKFISSEMSLMMVVWGRYIFNFIFIALFFFRRDQRDLARTRRLNLQILRSLLNLGATTTFWGALIFLPLADCSAIAFISPLLVTVLSVPFLGERVDFHRWVAVIIGLCSEIIIIRPGMGIFHWAIILPLIAALFWANYQITTRILSRTDSALTTLFYTAAGGLVFSSFAVLFAWETPSLEQWFFLAWLGFLGTVGHYLMIKAFEMAPASMLAPFNYTTLIWAILIGFVFFGDFPDAWTIAGAVIIVSSGLYVIFTERRIAMS